MSIKNNGQEFEKSNTTSDLIKMQTEFALLDSMFKSKTLSIMVILGVIGFISFFYYLFKISGV